MIKSETFNRIKVLDNKSKEILSRLIRKEFDSIPSREFWRVDECNELIKTANNLGLIELASEMTKDLG